MDFARMTAEEFVDHFISNNKARLNKTIRKYLIPNRYDIDDVKQYISIKILDILKKREHSQNPIENPTKYFSSCIDFYCIEYQREHGFVFGLPRRPRKHCLVDEEEARSKGFKYIDDITIDESISLVTSIEIEVDEPNQVAETAVWTILTGALSPEEAQVMSCVYLQNLTWKETAMQLGIPQSTCWSWKNKGLEKIFNKFDCFFV